MRVQAIRKITGNCRRYFPGKDGSDAVRPTIPPDTTALASKGVTFDSATKTPRAKPVNPYAKQKKSTPKTSPGKTPKYLTPFSRSAAIDETHMTAKFILVRFSVPELSSMSREVSRTVRDRWSHGTVVHLAGVIRSIDNSAVFAGVRESDSDRRLRVIDARSNGLPIPEMDAKVFLKSRLFLRHHSQCQTARVDRNQAAHVLHLGQRA